MIILSDDGFCTAPHGWARNAHRYSITALARVSIKGAMVILRAFAVFRLITSSKFVGCWTGKSAGFAPFSSLAIWSTESA